MIEKKNIFYSRSKIFPNTKKQIFTFLSCFNVEIVNKNFFKQIKIIKQST